MLGVGSVGFLGFLLSSLLIVVVDGVRQFCCWVVWLEVIEMCPQLHFRLAVGQQPRGTTAASGASAWACASERAAGAPGCDYRLINWPTPSIINDIPTLLLVFYNFFT